MLFNIFPTFILRSPLHGLLSRSIMLITVRGRKSGRAYTTPVNYVSYRDDAHGEQDMLLTVSFRQRTWWRNLRGSGTSAQNGVPVTLVLAGRERKGYAEVDDSDAVVAAGLTMLLKVVPAYAARFGVGLDADGQPKPADLANAARDKVIIRTRLT